MLPKSDDLSIERACSPMKYLYACYKIVKGIILESNNTCDSSQLGTSSGVLGAMNQLSIDNAIMNQVKERRINL